MSPKTRIQSPGYITIRQQDIVVVSFFLGCEGESLFPSPQELPTWSYFRSLIGSFQVVLDPVQIATYLNFASLDPVSLIVRWSCLETGFHGYSEPVTLSESQSIEVDFRIPGARLRKSVRVELMLILAGQPSFLEESLSQVTAATAGAILWRHAENDIQLESDVEQMPMEDVAFGNENALWEFEIDSHNLHELASRCLLVRLNIENRSIRKLKDDPASDSSLATSDFLVRDFYRAVLLEAVFLDELDEEADYEPSSIGGFMHRVINITGLTRQQLKVKFGQSRVEFESLVQSVKWGA